MPPKATVDWKSSESTTRLVAAILAAHPELKLNYTGQFTYFLFSPSLWRSFEVTVLFSSSLDLDGPAFLFSSPFLFGAFLYAHHRRVFQTGEKKHFLQDPISQFPTRTR